MRGRFVGVFLWVVLSSLATVLTGQTIAFVDEDGNEAASYHEASRAYVQFNNPGDNTDPFLVDTVQVTVTSALGGDSESLFVVETHENSGVFEGSLDIAAGAATSENGVLETATDVGPPFTRDTLQASDFYGVITDQISLVGASIEFQNAFGVSTSEFVAGAPVIVEVIDPLRGDPNLIDQIAQTVTVPGKDSEVVDLVETGYDSGIYRGTGHIASTVYPQPPAPLLDAVVGDLIETTYVDTDDPGSSTQVFGQVVDRVAYLLDEDGEQASVVLESSVPRIQVRSPASNVTSGVDTLNFEVSSALNGDSEVFYLTETGNDTAIFEGVVELALSTFPTSNGFLETTQSEGPPHSFDTILGDQGAFTLAETLGSRLWFINSGGQTVDQVVERAPIFLRVEDHNIDQSPTRESATVEITVPSTGDVETVSLVETGGSTGIFEGTIALVSSYGGASSGDGLLQVDAVNSIEARHDDALGLTQSVADATVVLAKVEFLDEDGQPTTELLEGSQARLRVTHPVSNTNPGDIDVFYGIDLTTRYSGDYEPVIVPETGLDTGVFEISLPMSRNPVNYNGALETSDSGSPVFDLDEVTAQITSWSSSPVTAKLVGSKISFLDGAGNVVDHLAIGQPIRIRVQEPLRGNSFQVDAFDVTLRSVQSGDEEVVTLTETGASTGLFEGSIDSGNFYLTTNDGFLHVVTRERIEVEHTSATYENRTAQATIVGVTLEFVDENGQPAPHVLQGDHAYVRLFDDVGNVSPGVVDTVSVSIESAFSGDNELMWLTETGADTGIFEGSMPTSVNSVQPENGTLELTEDLGPPHSFDEVVAYYFSLWGVTEVRIGSLGSITTFIDATGVETDVFAAGTTAYIRVEDHNLGTPGVLDSAYIDVSSTNGDMESWTLLETGLSSSIYEGSIDLSLDFATLYSGVIEAQPGDQITVTYQNALGLSSSSDEATLSDGILQYIDEHGNATGIVRAGGLARLRLISATQNQDPGMVEGVTVDIQSLSGDIEQVNLTETGPDSGIFEGSIPHQELSVFTYNGILETPSSPSGTTDEFEASLGSLRATAELVIAEVYLINAEGQVVTAYPVGDRVGVRIIDQRRNYDPGVPESVELGLDNVTNGDLVTYFTYETGPDTGIFEGFVQTAYAPLQFFDSELQVAVGDIVQQVYFDTSAGLNETASATMLDATIEFVDANGQSTSVYLESSVAYVRVFSAVANSNPSAVDSVFVDLSAAINSDFESLTLFETGPNSSVFEGSIPLGLKTVGASSSNGILETSQDPANPTNPFDRLTVTYNGLNGSLEDTATTLGSRTWFIDAYGALTSSYATGTVVSVRVENHTLDTPGVFDTATVSVFSSEGDAEDISLLETGRDTGIFEGSIQMVDSSFGSPSDGLLQALVGSQLNAEHFETLGYSSSTDTAMVDSAAIQFVDENGEPTSTVLEDGMAYLRVESLFDNADPGMIDSVNVTVTSL